MKTNKLIKDKMSLIWLIVLAIFIVKPLITNASSTKVIYPLKQISKLECRFTEFDELSSSCKQNLPILNTKDYSKYATKDGGYNEYTRIYTMLWGASYKYGWDVGNGGHIGTDIATSKGTPVYSIADGKVIKAKNDIMEGLVISIEHSINGKFIVSNYFHLSKMNVKKGDIIKVGTKIGEVGSTGNSTGNHLHFQIDLDTPFHPYYYNYNACPYSYYKITEDGVCFDELAKNTIDPLLFLETKGAIVEKINTSKYVSTKNTTNEDLSIFDRTVYIGYSKNDIKKVQEIFKKIGYYKGSISGKYEDVESSVIKYQISKKLIADKNSYGAGRFGPKTRYQAKKDYLNNVSIKNNPGKTVYIGTKKPTINTKKIERKNLLSREEIEKREVESFLQRNKVELYFTKGSSNIKKGETNILKLKVKNYKGKAFKGTMPGGMTFIVNSEKVDVFPKKLFYFTDGQRDIKLTGKNDGNTNLYIKIGNTTIKTINLKVYDSKKTIYPESAKIISSSSITLGENKTGIVLFKDNKGKNLINLPYGSTFKIKANDENKICIKKGSIKNVKTIYKSKCRDEDYKNEIVFNYNDTVGGLLIYDYKAISSTLKIDIINNYNNKSFNKKLISVKNPKGLYKNYAYRDDIIELLKKGIADGVKKGYFMENRNLTKKDALRWIKNSLISMKEYGTSNYSDNELNKNINELNKVISKTSSIKTITRKEFLDITNRYLASNIENNSTIKYKDLDSETNKKVSKIFNSDITWKDKFGKSYFRPNEKITRGEGVYFLSQNLNKIHNSYLTLK